jgi:hypothetical protein
MSPVFSVISIVILSKVIISKVIISKVILSKVIISRVIISKVIISIVVVSKQMFVLMLKKFLHYPRLSGQISFSVCPCQAFSASLIFAG